MGHGFPRSALSIFAVLTIVTPMVLAILAAPAGAQQVTCNQGSGPNSATDQPFPDLIVATLTLERLDPGMTLTTEGQWILVNQPGALLVKVTVRNQGTAATTAGDGPGDGSFNVLLQDARPDGTTVDIGTRSVANLLPGIESPVLRFALENYNGTGEHKFIATADHGNKINERCVSQVPNTNVDRENNNVKDQRVLLAARPDLRVTALVPKAEVRALTTENAASKIFFNATISNAGTHRAFNLHNEANGFTALFKLNNNEAACRHTSNTVTIREILPGATKQVEVKCEIAKLTKDFNVSVDVDPTARVLESNEANNRFVRVFQLAIADLAANVTGVTGTTSEGAVPEFGTLSFTATVRNHGTANASTDDGKEFDWFVYLDQKRDNANNLIGRFTTKLAPGASAQQAFTIRPLERDLAVGPHKIFVVADAPAADGDPSKGCSGTASGCKVIESNTTNNEYVLTFEVARFEVELTAPLLAQRVSPGVDVRYPFNLTNAGNVKDEVAFSVTGAAVTTRVENLNGTAITGTMDLPRNATIPLVLVVQVPRDAAENASLNVTLRAASTVPRAGAADTLLFQTTVGPDQIAPVIEKAKPAGTVVGDAGDIELRITDNVAVTSVTYTIGGGTPTTLSVAAGSADTYRIPRPANEGPFTLAVTASDAKNNRAVSTFNLVVDTTKPLIQSIAVVEPAARSPAGVEPGTRITVTAEIREDNMRNATVRVGSVEVPMRHRGGLVWESVNLTAPGQPGEYRPIIYAFDHGGNMQRAVEDVDFVRVRGVDLSLLSNVQATPTNPRAGDTVQIRVTVQNVGLQPAVGVRVQLLIDGQVANERTVTIPAGGSQVVVLEWKAVAGPHTFNVLVDPDNQFRETSESNNQLFAREAALTTVFPKARVFTKEAAANDLPDLLVRYLWVMLLALAAIAVGAAAFFVKPT